MNEVSWPASSAMSVTGGSPNIVDYVNELHERLSAAELANAANEMDLVDVAQTREVLDNLTKRVGKLEDSVGEIVLYLKRKEEAEDRLFNRTPLKPS